MRTAKSLSPDGHQLIVGASGYQLNNINTGAVFSYKYDSSEWPVF